MKRIIHIFLTLLFTCSISYSQSDNSSTLPADSSALIPENIQSFTDSTEGEGLTPADSTSLILDNARGKEEQLVSPSDTLELSPENVQSSTNNQLSHLALPGVIPPPPVAMELAKYITYPVDLSNGLVKISIPLYEVVDGDITIPITLDYHASGLKPNARTNEWLGDGWSINAGPTLSRVINGGADEIYYYYALIASSQPTYFQLNQVANQAKDITLDEFYYSLLNTSGRLYFKRNSTNQLRPVAIPADSIKVTLPTANSYTNYINMTDTRGLQYAFGGGSSSTERKFRDLTNAQYGTSLQEVPIAWKIRSIYSPLTNRTVSFDYTNNVTDMPYFRRSDAVTLLDNYECQCTGDIPAIKVSAGDNNDKYFICSDVGSGTLTEKLPSELTLPDFYQFPLRSLASSYSQYISYIKKITFSGGTVTFTKKATGQKELSTIQVHDSFGTLVKTIAFTHTAYTTITPKSLVLNKITITTSGGSGEVKEEYAFTYYDGYQYNKNPRAIDKWGYYNGANNTTLVPTITTPVIVHFYPGGDMVSTITIPGGDRNPNGSAMQQGMLKTITHPTGGVTEFVYEPHTYIGSSGTPKIAGGLRIKQVKEIDEGRTIYRNYKYSTIGSSINGCGLLNVIPKRSDTNANLDDDTYLYYTETQCNTFLGAEAFWASSFKERVWSDNSIVSLFSSSGSSVSYPYVFETTSSDVNGVHIAGEQRHVFNVTPSYPLKLAGTNIVSDSKDEWRYGHLMSTSAYKGTVRSNLNLVHEKNLGYNIDFSYGQGDDKITQWYVYKKTRVYGMDEDMISNTTYKNIQYIYKDLSTGRRLLSTEIEKTYDGNNKIEETTNYTHDAYGNIKQTTKSTSLWDQKDIITYSYPQDMSGTVYTGMVNKNILNVPIEVKQYKNSVSTTNLLATVTTEYKLVNNLFYVPAQMIGKTKDDTQGRVIKFNLYDNYGNILEQENLDGSKEVYLWGYKGNYPVAKILGSNYNTVSQKVNTTTLNTGTKANIETQLSTLRNGFSSTLGVHVSTYTYKPLVGMISETDPRGMTTHYYYDGLGRLIRISVDENSTERTLQQFDYHYK